MLQRTNGFFGHIKKNHTRSLCMFAGFALSMQIAFAAILAVPLTFAKNYEPIFSDPLKYFADFGLIIFGVSLLLFLLSYFMHTALTRLTTGFHYVEDYSDRRLENITKNLAWTAGIPVPDIGIIETPALNSFACGLTPEDATLVVTRGLMNELDDDELQAVVAHEIVHIMNGDIGMMAAANASHSIIKLVNWINPFQFRTGKAMKSPVTGCFAVFLFPIMIPLIISLAVVGFAINLSSMLAGVTRYFVTSSREFIADAEAIRLTHNPAALISALTKIEGRSLIPHLDRMANAMMIDGPAQGELASHPPILERIEALMAYGGSMVHGAGQRKDTRTFGQRRTQTHYDGELARIRYRRNTDKGIVARVTSERDSNMFGMPPGLMTTVLGFGLMFMIIMNFSTWKVSSAMSKFEAKPRDAGIAPIIKMTPAFVVVDLDKTGLKVRPFHRNVTHVDFDQDGRREAVSWPKGSVGFLFVDHDGNGRVDFPHELLQTEYGKSQSQTSMSVLLPFDTNRNGQIDRHDAGYKKLKVWRNNGSVFENEEYETATLKHVGILSINVMTKAADYQESYKLPEGAQIIRTRPYVLKDNPKVYRGTREARVYEVAFETDISHFRDRNNQLFTMTDVERRKYSGQKKPVSNELTPTFAHISPELGLKEYAEKQKRAGAQKETPPAKLRGRRNPN